jgi:hypothetical protein
MAKTESLTQQRLKEVLHYDSDSGVFTWAIDRPMAPKAPKGKIAGGKDGHGYHIICIDGVRHSAHRLVWLYVHGFYPKEIDHQNHDRADNRLINLRATDRSGNGKNISKPIDNKSGVVGVSWTKRLGKRYDKWEVRACGKFLGYFDDFFEAVCKRKSAELRLNFHPNHGI